MSQLLCILDSSTSEMDSILLSAAWVRYLCGSGALILPYFPIRDHWSITSFIRKINTTIIIINNNKTYFCYLQYFAVLKNFFVAQNFFPKSKNFLPLKLCRLQNFLALCSCICLNTALSVMKLTIVFISLYWNDMFKGNVEIVSVSLIFWKIVKILVCVFTIFY